MAIPEKDWKWFGFAAHWILSDRCLFHLNTQIANYIISTVGECRTVEQMCDPNAPILFDEYQTITSGPEKYETMVFKGAEPCANPKCGCGAFTELVGDELVCERYLTRGEAQRGHLLLCQKYASE